MKNKISSLLIYNIGLIGDYASGKSTIIENFLDDEKKNVIRLSLAKISLESSETKDKTDTIKDKTDTIKEKILELLFWQAKVAVPNSILQSVYRPNKLLQGFSAFLFSLVFAFITFNKINLDIVLLGNYTKISFYIVLLGCFSLIFWQLINFFIFLKNLGFSKINLKSPNVDLEISKNPFYKHLAQIIFILEEIAKKNYFVLVEDLDRFNDIEIFTALREISLIINYRLKNKTLPFLYALNSGLFVPKDNNQNLANQNKEPQKSVDDICKFFDIIIPVLKFNNNHTAKEEILELITKEKTINSAEKDELEKVLEILCTNTVIDQRIAHNICNQYNFIERLKFSDKIYDKDNKARAKLLAMTIFSIFDPQEYNALNNASGNVWQLLENILTDGEVFISGSEFQKFFKELAYEIYYNPDQKQYFKDALHNIAQINQQHLKFKKPSLHYYNEDIGLVIDNDWEIKISNVSKELIKQKYIEKQDYRDYLNRDPFQKDKVDSPAK